MMFNIVKDTSGLEKVVLTEPCGSSAQVILYGGQVISWKNERGEELLFVSNKAHYKPPKAIRGGIPICFPQFGDFGCLEQHGFARNRWWAIDTCPSPLVPVNNNSTVDLILKSSEEDLKTWSHSFELRLRVSLSPRKLTLIPRVRNTNNKPFSFTFGLHTYLSVSDIRKKLYKCKKDYDIQAQLHHVILIEHWSSHMECFLHSEVRIEGLETLDYLDNLQRKERFTEQFDAITFDDEVDRIYLSTPTKIAVIDHEKKRTLELRKEGLPDAVVWNPWDKRSKAMADFGDDEYKHMVCIEAAAVEHPIVLRPHEEWKGRQELSTVSSSYFSGQLDPMRVLYG
eukprot:TRINITY_DN84_c0_g1_i3.p1 TRINITY_DN84_c0_g1~~TRINITY_DN84_c0_g1_i3.p1  ORF type:complete len:340 (+),score=56.65 TRINITY_DN84_c0_g1_i3:223-1242(+)